MGENEGIETWKPVVEEQKRYIAELKDEVGRLRAEVVFLKSMADRLIAEKRGWPIVPDISPAPPRSSS
jgi:hypothetical protein